MLLLCSDGLSSPALLEAVRPHVAGKRTAALVVTADDQYKERNWHVPRCTAELEALGLAVTPFDLDARPAGDLLAFDVVEFIGGNPFYLLHALRRADAREVLMTLARERLLIGWSAAAFVFGPTLALVNRYSPELNTLGLTDLTAMALTDAQVLPHYSRFLTRFENFEATCAAYERETGREVIRLDDGEGIMINEIGGRFLISFSRPQIMR